MSSPMFRLRRNKRLRHSMPRRTERSRSRRGLFQMRNVVRLVRLYAEALQRLAGKDLRIALAPCGNINNPLGQDFLNDRGLAYVIKIVHRTVEGFTHDLRDLRIKSSTFEEG